MNKRVFLVVIIIVVLIAISGCAATGNNKIKLEVIQYTEDFLNGEIPSAELSAKLSSLEIPGNDGGANHLKANINTILIKLPCTNMEQYVQEIREWNYEIMGNDYNDIDENLAWENELPGFLE